MPEPKVRAGMAARVAVLAILAAALLVLAAGCSRGGSEGPPAAGPGGSADSGNAAVEPGASVPAPEGGAALPAVPTPEGGAAAPGVADPGAGGGPDETGVGAGGGPEETGVGAGGGPEETGPAVAEDWPGMLDSVPRGALVYVDGEFLGTTPLPLERLPEHAAWGLIAPGYRAVVNSGWDPAVPELVRLTPLPIPDAAERDRLRAEHLAAVGWRWDGRSFRVDAGQLTPSPDGRYLAITVGGWRKADWGLTLLLLANLETGELRVLQEQPWYLVDIGKEFPTAAIQAVGWRDARRLVVLRTGEREPGAELAVLAEEYDVAGGAGARRAGALPLPADLRLAIGYAEAWLTDDALYLNSGQVRRVGLDDGETRLVRDLRPEAWFEPCGCVPLNVSPDGERAVYGLYGMGLLDLATGQDLAWLPEGVEVDDGAWSPDGRLLALRTADAAHPGRRLYADDSSHLLATVVRVLDRDGQPVLETALPDGALFDQLHWTPDGRELVVQSVGVFGEEFDRKLEDNGLYRVQLDGSVALVRPAAGRFLQLAGPGWVLEEGREGKDSAVTGWPEAAAPPPPPPPEPPAARAYALLPDGGLALVGQSGTVWTCAPGAAGCLDRGRLGDGFGLTRAGPWLIHSWYERTTRRQPSGGVRWDPEAP